MPLPGPRYHKHLIHPSNYPVITNLAWVVSGVNVTITWTTDVASTSQVAFGTNQNKDQRSPYDSTLVTSHSVTLSGLLPNTVYFFNVQSFNIDSITISQQDVFITGSLANQFILLEDGTYMLLEDGTKIILES